jgi:hypothetical protein
MEYKNKNYFLFTNTFLKDPRFTSSDKLVYLALESLINYESNTCKTTYKYLSILTSLSPQTIQRSVKHLKKIKVILVKRKSNHMIYKLIKTNILNEFKNSLTNQIR